MPPAPPTGGSPLTRKLGPLPVWAWAGVAVLGYVLWKRHQANVAAGTTSTAATTTPAASTLPYDAGAISAPSGYGYQGPGTGFGGSGPIPTGAVAATGGSQYVAPTGENFLGGGYDVGTGSSVTSPSGVAYEPIQQTSAVNAILGQGGQVYFQPAPGVFQPLPPGAGVGNLQGLPGNTPLFVRQQ